MALYVGTNYHPHDWTPERWREDIEWMKQAGFQVVRLGHLCWDSYEPDNGVYTFEWFDEVMDAFAQAEIKVLLDISMRPAPGWVHRICPGCDIYTKEGNRQAPWTRYMEDVDDPDYQFYAFRFARILVRRYKDHPALMAFGLCNEQGAGFISYSETARKRFQKWLEKKYVTIDSLNLSWNTQRWSRRLLSFEEVWLPENAVTKGAPEAYLDMRRFYSDGILNFMIHLKELVEQEAPGKMHSSNHVAEGSTPGFDYLKGCREFVDYPGIGFYPDIDPEDENAVLFALMIMQHRLAELKKPMWCIEFQTGDFGGYAGKEGVLRMYALLCLAYRTQMVLAWTWRSMLGGEEQFYFGLLDHDGTCGRKYYEFAQIAKDYRKLEAYHFPYLPKPEAAIAYCYENDSIYEYGTCFYRASYKQQIIDTMNVFYKRNLDCNIVDLRTMEENYRILLIPGHAIMTPQMADTVRNFVRQGGIAVMTAYSAKVNENNAVFDTPQPGLLSEVFGIRIAGFERTHVHPVKAGEKKPTKQLYVKKTQGSLTEGVSCEAAYWEIIERKTAKSYASYEGEEKKNQVFCGNILESCAVSVNTYGKGQAYYVSMEANTQILNWLYEQLAEENGLSRGIASPDGVVVRHIADGESFYVNTTGKTQIISLEQEGWAVLRETHVQGQLILAPYEGDLVVCEEIQHVS